MQPRHLENTAVKSQPRAAAMLLPLLACACVYLLAHELPRIVGKSTFWIFLPGFFTETLLLLCALALSTWLTKGRLADFGFTRGSFRLTAGFFLWLVPMLVIATLQVVGAPANAAGFGATESPIAVILTVWVYASICEEIFTRGLLQSWLAPLAGHRVRLGRWALSVPVLTAALFFAAMHFVLWPKLGPVTLVVVFLCAILGLIAGYYREKTGSLIPAILIHSFFDIGGTLPAWISAWLHRGRM
jgi:membrane protease YdiL (CAAX protease family)